MATITFTTKQNNVLADATSVVLSNASNSIGIKRNDTGDVVVAAGTVLTKQSTGTYAYTFTAPADNVFYTAYLKVIASGATLYHEVAFFVSQTTTTIMVPSAILSKYCIETLSVFTAPSETSTWPLYRSSLPDGPNIDDNIAAIYDTAGFMQVKDMGGSLHQRYGIQFTVRGIDYDTGYQKLASVLSAFPSIENVNVTVNGSTFRIMNISQTSSIGILGVEPGTKQRYLFSANLLVSLKEV